MKTAARKHAAGNVCSRRCGFGAWAKGASQAVGQHTVRPRRGYSFPACWRSLLRRRGDKGTSYALSERSDQREHGGRSAQAARAFLLDAALYAPSATRCEPPEAAARSGEALGEAGGKLLPGDGGLAALMIPGYPRQEPSGQAPL